jgi:hypothetical protein
VALGLDSGMTLNEAAATLGLSPDTLRVQVNKGQLKAKKVGPVWTVTPGEVERYRRESLGKRRYQPSALRSVK